MVGGGRGLLVPGSRREEGPVPLGIEEITLEVDSLGRFFSSGVEEEEVSEVES